MKKTNKKGFTLVELLAVIVILGVLLMIAVPAIQNVIKKSRKNSFESAAKLAIENVETIASTEKVRATISECFVPITEYEYTVNSKTEKVPKMDLERGSFGENAIGYIKVNSEGKGTIYLKNDDYLVNGNTLDNVKAASVTNENKDTITEANMKSTISSNICTWYYN